MRVLQQLGRTLPAGSVMLFLAACGSSMSTPTAPAAAVTAATAPATEASAVTLTVTIRGSVVDASNRPFANANIECLGDVQCKPANGDVGAEGHEHRAATTDANGFYEIVAARGSGAAASGFSMNANGPGYDSDWHQVEWPDPACASDQAGCAITVNFKLIAEAE
jgi:hypothetical protein